MTYLTKRIIKRTFLRHSWSQMRTVTVFKLPSEQEVNTHSSFISFLEFGVVGGRSSNLIKSQFSHP